MGLGIGTLDLADPDVRYKLRNYVIRFMSHCLRCTLFDLQRGAERGMTQALEFIFDADHAKTVKKRRKERADRREALEIERKRKQAIKECEKLGRVQ